MAAFEDHLIPVPDNMTFTQAAAIPEVWLTAFQLLNFVGQFATGNQYLTIIGPSNKRAEVGNYNFGIPSSSWIENGVMRMLI